MSAIAKRVIRQIAGDKRTVIMIIIAPMLILTLIYLLLGGTDYVPTIAYDRVSMSPFTDILRKYDVNTVDVTIDEEIFDAESYLIENRDVDAVFYFSAAPSFGYAHQSIFTMHIVLYESGSSKSNAAMNTMHSALAGLLIPNLEITFVVGSTDETMFDSLDYVFLGVISFFLIFIVSGMALVRERSAGTLERMLMTPVTRGGVVAGYTLGFGLFAVIQAVILVLFSLYVLGAHTQGSAVWVILIMLMLAITAVSFGQLISIFANTEFQVVQLIPIAIIPQIFFSGLIPLDTIPYGLGNLGYAMPVFYGCTAIKEVMRFGGGINTIWPYLLALLGYIAVLSILNITALKKYRKI